MARQAPPHPSPARESRPPRAAAAPRPHPLLAAPPALRGGRGARWWPPPSTWSPAAARSWSSTRRRIQLDKARSLSQQVVDLREQPAVADRSPSRARSRWTPRATSSPAAVARIREADGLERYVGGHEPFVLRQRGRRHAARARARASSSSEPAIEQLLQEGVLRGLQGKPDGQPSRDLDLAPGAGHGPGRARAARRGRRRPGRGAGAWPAWARSGA